MKRDELGDLVAFLAVVEAGGFTRAAARLGTSQSALSHTIQRLETRLGVRLLNRTTRRVVPSEAGETLAAALRPGFDGISEAVDAVQGQRDCIAGTVRISTSAHAAETVLWPAVSSLVSDHPALKVELNVESRFTDIVAERFDAGVRLGESLEADMIAVRIGPDMKMALVASPDHSARHGTPAHPQELTRHACINLRFDTMSNLYAWEFARDGREVTVRVEGPLTFNTAFLCRAAAVEGHGWAFLPEDHVGSDLAAGRLVRALEEWCPSFAGYYLYHPSRRLLSPALQLVIERLRWRRMR